MREIVSPLSGIRSPFGGRVDPYKVAGFRPALVADMSKDYFRNVSRQTFDDIFTTSRLGLGTMTDSDGLLKWAPHNLLTYSEQFDNAAWTKNGVTVAGTDTVTVSSTGAFRYIRETVTLVAGVQYTFEVDLEYNGHAFGWVLADGDGGDACIPFTIAADAITLGTSQQINGAARSGLTATSVDNGDGSFRVTVIFTSSAGGSQEIGIGLSDSGSGNLVNATAGQSIKARRLSAYRSDLGGMAPVPSDARVAGSTTYVPTTSTAKYLPRRHNHKYDGSAWVDAGTLIETELRTQLLHTTNALVTQSHTVTAVPHTLHFTGTGTVTLSGASTAGPLVGTGSGEENRVSLTFTPTAASLTLTVTGTVTDAQLEVGSTPSSYIPNLAGSGTVLRAADSPLTIAGADVPWPTPTVIGDELVTNGDFATGDLTGWSIGGTDATHFVEYSAGGARYVSDTTSPILSLSQTGILTIGKVYEISVTTTAYTSGSLKTDSFSGTSVVSNGLGTITIVGVASSTSFVIVRNSANVDATIDNISVKEINPLTVCIQMEGDLTYADDGAGSTVKFVRWEADTNNLIDAYLRTDGAATGGFIFRQKDDAVSDVAESATTLYSPGVNVPFNIASRHGSTFINGAVDGTALTADTTPVALPDLSSTDLEIAYDFMGNVKQVRIWAVDIGDTGIAEASS